MWDFFGQEMSQLLMENYTKEMPWEGFKTVIPVFELNKSVGVGKWQKHFLPSSIFLLFFYVHIHFPFLRSSFMYREREFTVTVMHHEIACAARASREIKYSIHILCQTSQNSRIQPFTVTTDATQICSSYFVNRYSHERCNLLQLSSRWTNWNAIVVKGSQSSCSRCAKGFL